MNKANLTKVQAIEAMKQGKKLKHRFFTEGEYITMDNNKINTEDGYLCTAQEFWAVRFSEAWHTGWYIID